MNKDLNKMLALWWEAEPEYARILPNGDERPIMREIFWDVIEAVERRDWIWRLEEDSMYSARILGEGGYMADPCTGTGTVKPWGMVEALLEAYLKGCAQAGEGQ
ncbi:hypothetical protein [Deinococcus sp. QL22]|uniref:hypothetical protein n=1 Tax=Deinococcus sp. QL22 TaxID=2939437 RepID=UPI002016EE60|nr:hypothetical protein [Deinococcus sp. QL22]UQN06783.1 hypothetical protein M1R55_02345 [Deinococcus sp. QL22]